MTMTINGSGTITGLSAGGLPNATVTNDDLSLSANASNVMTALNASGSAPIYACRAWVNFNGSGTVAIRASGNVLGITDNGTGAYTVNLMTAMPDANYAVTLAASRADLIGGTDGQPTTTAFNVNTRNGVNVNTDTAGVFAAIFR